MTIDEFWRAVEAWDARHPLAQESLLEEPANDAQFVLMKSMLPVAIPANLLALLRQHNGAGKGWYCFSDGNFLSASEISSLYTEAIRLDKEIFANQPVDHIEAVGPVQVDFSWRAGWVPFLKRNKEPVCIDLEPATGGNIGQIIEVDREGGKCSVLAPSLEDYLKSIVVELEQ